MLLVQSVTGTYHLFFQNTAEWHMRCEGMELVIRVLKKQSSRVQKR